MKKPTIEKKEKEINGASKMSTRKVMDNETVASLWETFQAGTIPGGIPMKDVNDTYLAFLYGAVLSLSMVLLKGQVEVIPKLQAMYDEGLKSLQAHERCLRNERRQHLAKG